MEISFSDSVSNKELEKYYSIIEWTAKNVVSSLFKNPSSVLVEGVNMLKTPHEVRFQFVVDTSLVNLDIVSALSEKHFIVSYSQPGVTGDGVLNSKLTVLTYKDSYDNFIFKNVFLIDIEGFELTYALNQKKVVFGKESATPFLFERYKSLHPILVLDAGLAMVDSDQLAYFAPIRKEG